MIDKKNYYFYYSDGSGSSDSFINKKEIDINNIIRFLDDSSKDIYKLILDKRLNKGFFKVFEENEINAIDLVEWVNDVETLIKKELRDLKINVLTNESLNELWGKLDMVGLTGIQLKSKLNFWYKLFEKIRNWFNGIVFEFEEFRIDLINALKATNIIYKSLCKVLIGIEPLIELKDFFDLTLEIDTK